MWEGILGLQEVLSFPRQDLVLQPTTGLHMQG